MKESSAGDRSVCELPGGAMAQFTVIYRRIHALLLSAGLCRKVVSCQLPMRFTSHEKSGISKSRGTLPISGKLEFKTALLHNNTRSLD